MANDFQILEIEELADKNPRTIRLEFSRVREGIGKDGADWTRQEL